MDRPLWKDLRRQRAQSEAAAGPKPARAPRYGLTILSALGAVAAFGVGSNYRGDLHHLRGDPAGFANLMASTVVFVGLGIYTTRRFARQMGELIAAQGGRAAGAAIRLVAVVVGVTIVVLAALTLLGISVYKLLVGGVVTGVVLGIAAQQSLGNVFAGLVLIFSRPFTVGSYIRVRSGSLGGPFEGEVVSVGLTYVVIEMEDGQLNVPNLGMLAAAVVQIPPPSRAKASELYVARRSPRHSATTARRQSAPAVPHQIRRPRELIRRVRQRHAAESPLPSGAPDASGDGAAPPAATSGELPPGTVTPGDAPTSPPEAATEE